MRLELPLLAVLALAGVSTAVWILWKARRNPKERERRRRLLISRRGRMGDGMITDVSEEFIYYSYSVSGVDYTASQEVGGLRPMLPEDLSSLIGPVTLKFMTRNPFNSIVFCEEWSGFRRGRNAATE